MPSLRVLNELQIKQNNVITTYKLGTVNGYYNPIDGKFYEESTHVTEIEGAPNLVYADIAGNNLYIWKTATSSFVKVSGEGGGGGLVYGYLNETDGKFYEDSSYTTEIPGDEDKLFITLDDNYIYRYDTTNTEFVQIGGSGSATEGAVFGYLNPADGKFYKESTYVTEITPDENNIYVDLNTNFIYRYNVTDAEYVQIGGEKSLYFGYYDSTTDKFYAESTFVTALEENENYLYTDISVPSLYRYRTTVPTTAYYAWKEAISLDIYYTLSETPSVGDALYSAIGVLSDYAVASYDSTNDEITFEDDESNEVTLGRDNADDDSTSESHFVTYDYELEYLTANDIDELMDSVAHQKWEYLGQIIDDTAISLIKVWSSNKVNSELSNTLDTAKAYTDEEITRFKTASYKVVSSTEEMINASYIYLLPVSGSDYYDMYILSEGTPVQIGTSQAQLDDYYTKTQADNRFLRQTVAATTYVDKVTYANEVGDVNQISSDFSSSTIVGCLNETTTRENVDIDWQNDF